MRHGILISIITIIYAFLSSIQCKNKFYVTFRLYSYSHKNDYLHNENKCESFHLFADYCDPMFDVQIVGHDSCSILTKRIESTSNIREIAEVMRSSWETKCNLNEISIKVDVKDHDQKDSYAFIDTFKKILWPKKLSNFESSGYLDRLFKSGAQLKYSIKIRCASNFYGYNCNIYCKKTKRFNCNSKGEKVCYDNYYGNSCDKECTPSSYHKCDQDGNKICKDHRYGDSCGIRCFPGATYKCNSKGEKVCTLSCPSYKICLLDPSLGSHFKCACPPGKTGKYCVYKLPERTTIQSTMKVSTRIVPTTSVETKSENGKKAPLIHDDKNTDSNKPPINMLLIYMAFAGLLLLIFCCMIALIIVLRKRKKTKYQLEPMPSVVYRANDAGIFIPTRNELHLDSKGRYSTDHYVTVKDNESRTLASPRIKSRPDEINHYSSDYYATVKDDRHLLKPFPPARNGSVVTETYTEDDEGVYELPKFDEENNDMCTMQTILPEYPNDNNDVYLNPLNNN